MTRRLILVAVLAILATPAFAAAPPQSAGAWEPAKTYGVIVGVLQWEKGALPAFSLEKRKDQELYDVLVGRGVPKENLRLLLDKEATYKAIEDAVRDVAKKAPVGSTFVFYYAGHGGLLPDGGTTICNYDLAGKNATKGAYPVSALADTLKETFRGDRVMFFADCCYSGGLARAAKALEAKGKAALALTSANDECISGGTWIYTMTLLDALRGEPIADRNGDGSVSLREMAREIADNVGHRAGIHYGYYASPGFDASFRFAKCKGERNALAGPLSLGQFVHLPESPKSQRIGRVVGHDGERYQVQVHEYATRPVITVSKDKLIAVPLPRFEIGERVHVFDRHQVSPAKVLGHDGDYHRVRYDGGKREEWVLPDRIIAEAELKGRTVEVLWSQSWYPAVVLQRQGKRALIRYLGYDASWDEWVGPERMRQGMDTSLRGIVFVKTGGAWLPAEVMQVQEKKALVRYHGCSDESNEWVALEDVVRVDAKKERPALVEQKGAWRAAVVLKRVGKSFEVRFVGEKDEQTVNAERVKLLATK